MEARWLSPPRSFLPLRVILGFRLRKLFHTKRRPQPPKSLARLDSHFIQLQHSHLKSHLFTDSVEYLGLRELLRYIQAFRKPRLFPPPSFSAAIFFFPPSDFFLPPAPSFSFPSLVSVTFLSDSFLASGGKTWLTRMKSIWIPSLTGCWK